MNRRRAEQLLREALVDVAERKRNPMQRRADGTGSLWEFVAKHEAAHVAKLKDARHVRQRLAVWGDVFPRKARLCDVTREAVETAMAKWKAGTLGDGRHLEDATITRRLRALQKAMNQALAWQLVPYNPIAKMNRPKESEQGGRALTDDECARLVWACRESSNPILAPFVIACLASGARCGELVRLEWQDVQVGEEPVLTFRHTKSSRTRHVPIRPEAMAELEALPRRHARVFTLDGRPIRVEPRDALKRAVKAAGLQRIGFHDLRRKYASNADRSGQVGAGTLQRLLGHASLTTTQRYIKADPALRGASDAMGAYWQPLRRSGQRKQRGSKP